MITPVVGTTFWILVTAADFDDKPGDPPLTPDDIDLMKVSVEHLKTQVKVVNEETMDFEVAKNRWVFKWQSEADNNQSGTFNIRVTAKGPNTDLAKKVVKLRLEKDPLL